jgi:bifunctional non-homologous end joining protein LigD
MVFDLDPDPAVGFADLASAAVDIRDLLASVRLPSFAMVTGGKGIHVIVPLKRRATQDAVATFARSFATILADQDPARFVATMSKAKRAGRIFVDWLRNQREATAVCPWSVRARPGARVAVPVTWDELPRLPDARSFTLDAARERASTPPQRPAASALTADMIAGLNGLVAQTRR